MKNGTVSRLLQTADKLFFPPRCPYCGEVLGFLPECPGCKEKTGRLKLPQGGVLPAKWHKMEYLSEAYAVYAYEDFIEKAIYRFKFSGDIYLAQPFAQEMAALLKDVKADAVIPVPASVKEQRRHQGCHGALLLAEKISRQLEMALWRDILQKPFETEPQHKLSALRRGGNLAGSMRVAKPAQIKDKTILLVDDIITTGNTLDYCAKLCMAYGARRILSVCYAASLCEEERAQLARLKEKETKKGEGSYGAE